MPGFPFAGWKLFRFYFYSQALLGLKAGVPVCGMETRSHPNGR